MKNLSIIGTDTGIGKTLCGAIIGAKLNKLGFNCIPYKPIETGCKNNDFGEDIKFLINQYGNQAMQKTNLKKDQLQLYRYSYPCSPHLACEIDNSPPPDLDKIISNARLLQKNGNVIFEGCGGILVPINRTGATVLDLVKKLNFPCVIISRSGLGAINHISLTIEILQRNNIEIAGFIFNDTSNINIDFKLIEDNISIVQSIYKIPYLGRIKCLSNSQIQNQDFDDLINLDNLI